MCDENIYKILVACILIDADNTGVRTKRRKFMYGFRFHIRERKFSDRDFK
jgi:hypothetical protein